MKSALSIFGLLLIFVLAFVCEPSFAQAQAVATPTYLDGVLKFLAGSSAWMVGVLAVIEVVFRLFPSKNPLSLLVPVQYLVSGLIVILGFLKSLLDSLISSAQNLSQPKP